MCKTMASVTAHRRNVIQSSHREKETIHSGHFMVSHFEADAQDDEYEVAVPVPEVSSKKLELIPFRSAICKNVNERQLLNSDPKIMSVSIETSLTKLFQCMSIAYRQKLTSPKWNRFRGVRLRWKEKIRLNNVIWRCWHMQFMKKRNIGVCQFASPLDVDVHSKPEAVVLEGKYWKRKLSAVTAEYKRWRIFYQKFISSPVRGDQCDEAEISALTDWNPGSVTHVYDSNMMVDEDYMDFMSDTLFSTITSNQPFAFPDTREIARATGLADLIQPSLVQLQPNLDDYMDMLEPLPDLLSPSNKLASVPEEYHPSDDLYRPLNNVGYTDVCNTPSFYNPHPHPHPQHQQQQQNTSSSVNISSNISENNIDQQHKMYIKSEEEQPLQLSVTHSINSKQSSSNNYHNSDSTSLYQESSGSPSMYSTTTQSGTVPSPTAVTATGYPSYQTQHYQTGQQQVGTENAIVNYSHQINKNVPAQSTTAGYNTVAATTAASLPNCHHYSSYDPTTNCYTNVPSSSIATQQHQQGYSPSSSSNYKILPSSRSVRSGSISTNNEEELFAVPKLSQRGRSRSGSSLLATHARFMQNDSSCAADVAAATPNCALLTQLLTNTSRHYGYPSSGYSMSGCGVMGASSIATSPYGCSGGSSGHDIRTCYTINGHRREAHCTALLGRRSRTPDHILSSNANPVGYCKPRTPVLSSQNNYHEGSLINLSHNQREGFSDKVYSGSQTLAEEHSTTHKTGNSPLYGYSTRQPHFASKNLGKYDKYTNSSSYQGQMWNSTNIPSSSGDPCYSSSPIDSGGSPSGTNPFIFTGNHHSNTESANLSQLMNHHNSSSSSPKHPSSPSTSESLSLSPLTVSSPVRGTSSSPNSKTVNSSTPYKEHRRVCHINAEQKRRCNIKNGFDTLHQLIPHLAQNPNMKMSKAAMLQKGAEYIRTLRGERSQLRDEIESLKQQVETLNLAISNCQSLLPVTGAPISRHKADKMKEMFDEYVKERTKQNWKFWILSLICEPLLTSFNSSVSNTNIEELFRSTLQWAEQYCSLVDLRPVVLNALRHVCTSTEILSNPNQLPDEARAIVLNSNTNSCRN